MEEIQAEKVYSHGKTDARLFSWPWGNLGVYKYFLYGPFLASVIYSRIWEGETHKKGYWCMHVLAICALRGLVYQLWSSHSNMLFNNRTQRLSHRGIDFEQIDNEWDWDNFLILQAMVGAVACLFFLPLMESLPIWNLKGVLFCLILHMGFSEPVYYWIHRFLHSDHMFLQFHWLHHSSKVIHPFTAGHATFMEHLLMCMIVGMPILGTLLAGLGSISMIYGYLLVFDSLRCLGHYNVEIVPHTIFRMFPFLRYCVYTPTYHSLHHQNMSTNFCLFMPLYDVMWKTIHHQSWDLHKKMSTGSSGKHKINVPDFVFLAHIVDVSHALHSPFVFRSFGSTPCRFQHFIPFLWPVCLIVLLAMWAKSNTFLISFYRLKGQLLQIWCVPRFGLQYFLPFAKEGINKQIEEAILKCDKLGVKVVSLAALNKNEALNGGGALYVERHPNLRVRVVHGNTLTAAVIINEIPKDVVEVFLVGSTSKLGRAIALYLARRHIRVMMLTQSTERFTKIQKEASEDCRGYLVQVTKYQAAQHCKTWIMGKWATPQEQLCAPKGTHFHQFVVPTIIPFRRDCTYGKLAAMSLPKNVEGLGTCEYELPRGVVHACHAGGVVHLLEGWNHHEVGAINVDQIDVVWNAAQKHGFKSF